jgi:AcrR family transcriptional regulator
MPKVTQEYRDARREQILSAARRCFLRDGFHATSMQDLFAESGLSSGAVYRYFASKDEVIIAIAAENMQDIVAMIHSVATQAPDRSVGAVLADVFDMVRDKHAANGLGGLAVLVWSEALRNPALADQFMDLLRQLRADLGQLAQTQQRSGDLPSEVSAEALAAVLMSMVPGYILQLALLGPDAVEGAADAVRALWPGAEHQPAPIRT